MDSAIGNVQTWVPLLGGFGVLIWLVWRLFWKVDKRSQQDLAIKDAEIIRLTARVESERQLRFRAEERATTAESREKSLEAQISDLSDQIKELRDEVGRLRIQQQQQNAAQNNNPTRINPVVN